MSKKDPKFCPYCGASMDSQEIKLGRVHLDIVRRLGEMGGSAYYRDMALGDATRFGNLSATKHWSLTSNRPGKKGMWDLTITGWQWLLRKERVPEYVTVFRKQVVDYSGRDVGPDDIDPSLPPWTYEDFAAHRVSGLPESWAP